MRGRLFSLDKPAGVYRIAVVGDSISFGWMVNERDSFPRVLERMLNKPGGKKFEVINFSVPGYNITQELELVKTKVLQFHPDMVILSFCGNDDHLSSYIQPEINFVNYLFHKSYLIHFIIMKMDLYFVSRSGWYMPVWNAFKKKILKMYYWSKYIYPFPGLEAVPYIGKDLPATRDLTPKRYWHMLGKINYKLCLGEFSRILNQSRIAFISCGYFSPWALAIHEDLPIKHTFNFRDYLTQLKVEKRDIILSDFDLHPNVKGHQLMAQGLSSLVSAIASLDEEYDH
ncbi:MAG: SGNH/GDSL hydrolase family protein [Candidatus Omnitrophica bacterium]|nr:SGNH/GDSL hydrolase family protein [Candidatus Omnitrophota bacterium]